MTLLGFERGEAAATSRSGSRPSSTGLLLLAKERGVDDDPVIRQRLAWCYAKVQIMRYLGMRTLTQFLRRPPPRSRRWHQQAVLERVPQGRHRAGARHPRCRGARADRAPPVVARSRPTTPARRTRRRRGSTRSSTPAPARSTPGRRRSSATSSARWCSGCPKEPPLRRDGRAAAVRCGRSPVARACGRPPCASGGGLVPDGWWRRRPFLPLPARGVRRLPVGDAVRRFPHQRVEPADVVNYLAWCRAWDERRDADERTMRSALVLNATYEPLSVVAGSTGRLPRPRRQGRRDRGGRHRAALAVDRRCPARSSSACATW